MFADRIADGLEPALHAAIQRIVVAALVMRLVGLAEDASPAGTITGEATAPITTAIRHVGVNAEIIPTLGETGPIAQTGCFKDVLHFGRPHKGKAGAVDLPADQREGIVHPLHVVRVSTPSSSNICPVMPG